MHLGQERQGQEGPCAPYYLNVKASLVPPPDSIGTNIMSLLPGAAAVAVTVLQHGRRAHSLVGTQAPLEPHFNCLWAD